MSGAFDSAFDENFDIGFQGVMATTLTLTAGGESIDFIGGTEFRLIDNGLELPSPSPVRVMAGAPPLREGQSLVERKYGNREIAITFHAKAATNDTLQASVSKLHRILNYAAKAQASHGLLEGATLSVKMENQTDAVTFDILDGEVRMSGPLQTLVRRSGPLLDNELILTALPYGRGSVVRLENHLVNPFFDINPMEEGRDGGYYVTFGASGDRYERANCDGLYPAGAIRYMFSVWCYPTNVADVFNQTILACGDPGTGWQLIYNPLANAFAWDTWGNLDDPINVITDYANKEYPHNNWYHITGICLDTEGDAATKIAMLFVNDHLATYVNFTSTQIIVPTGKFTVGALANDSLHFDGRICGAAVITRNVWPWQVKLLYKYGMRSLIRGDTTLPGHAYWDLKDEEYGAVWPFDESSTTQDDDGPGLRHLTTLSAAPHTQNLRHPQGILVADSPTNSTIDLDSSVTKYGRFSAHLVKNAVSVPCYIGQSVAIPIHKQASSDNRDWELFFWAKSDGVSDDLLVYIRSDPGASIKYNANVTIASDLTLYGVKFTTDATDTDIVIILGQITGTTPLNIHVAAWMLCPGTPFGMTATPTAVTKQIPFISGMGLIADEDSQDVLGKSRQLRVYNLPGDFVASRTYVENPSA